MKKIVNLTPHEIVLFSEDGTSVLEKFPSMGIARASVVAEPVTVDGCPYPVTRNTYGDPIGLPEKSDDTLYVVSLITAQAAVVSGRGNEDLLLTSDLVRDDEGRIIGCKAFSIL